jgi:hypothetical protein
MFLNCMCQKLFFFRIAEAVSVREVCRLWFVVDWNFDLKLPEVFECEFRQTHAFPDNTLSFNAFIS